MTAIAMRDWMRTRSYDVPVNTLGTTDEPGDQIVLTQLDGPADPTVVGMYEAVIRIDIHGTDSYDRICRLSQRITEDLQAVTRTQFNESTTCFGASIDSTLDSPIPGASEPRRVLTSRATFLHNEGD